MNGDMNNNKNIDFNHDDRGNSVKRRKVKNDEDNSVNNENDLIKINVQGVVLGNRTFARWCGFLGIWLCRS
jgi:hypothetical protein